MTPATPNTCGDHEPGRYELVGRLVGEAAAPSRRLAKARRKRPSTRNRRDNPSDDRPRELVVPPPEKRSIEAFILAFWARLARRDRCWRTPATAQRCPRGQRPPMDRPDRPGVDQR